MDNYKDNTALLKDPAEAARHLNSSIASGDLEFFLYGIRELAQANGDVNRNGHSRQRNADFAAAEGVGEEVQALFHLVHSLGLRLVPRDKVDGEPLPVSLPASCRLEPDSIRKNRFGELHTKEEIDSIIGNLPQLQLPGKEFIDYVTTFCWYRNEFYKRGEARNEILTATYAFMTEKENVSLICKFDIDPVVYRLIINYNQSLDDSLKNIKEFCKDTEKAVRLQYQQDEEDTKSASRNGGWGLMSIRSFLMESAKKKKNPFEKWAVCLNVYDVWKKNPEKDPQEIATLVNCPYVEHDTSNRNHYVSDHHKEALRLITSAENGTFPY